MLLTRSFAKRFEVKASPSLWVFSAQHGKEKKERMAKKGERGKDKKRGLCSPLERRADVNVDVKEGGEKNESKQDKNKPKQKQESFSLGFLFCGSVMGTKSSSFPRTRSVR